MDLAGLVVRQSASTRGPSESLRKWKRGRVRTLVHTERFAISFSVRGGFRIVFRAFFRGCTKAAVLKSVTHSRKLNNYGFEIQAEVIKIIMWKSIKAQTRVEID